MARTAKLQQVAIDKLVPYERNAKTHDEEQVAKIAASIQEFGFLSPILIDEQYNIVAGHGRVLAAKTLGMDKVPAVFLEGLTEAQRRAYIIADNRLTELGGWDMDLVYEELPFLADAGFDVKLTGFDWDTTVAPSGDSWFEKRDRWDDSRQEGNDEYNEFVEKFEEPKTTDDCYTPDNIYDVVAGYVERKYKKKRENFQRPFYPGGDYRAAAETYKAGDVVVDNPPFSILAEIIDFYISKQQPFFLFCPGLSALGYLKRESVTAICTYAQVTYENGAAVVTSFVTNMGPQGVAAISDPELYSEIEAANDINEKAMRKSFPKYEFPYEVLTAAKMGWLAKYGQSLQIKREDSVMIRTLDAMKEQDKGIYGGALLLSERAAAERAAAERAAAERAAAERAAAERAAAVCWELSDREREIIAGLGK